MKYFIFFISILIFLPNALFADQSIYCASSGYTVVTVNGVFTGDQEARKNKDALQNKLAPYYNSEPITIDYLLNPPHLGGIGDIIKSIEQGLFDQETVTDYDLVEMLKSASEKVRTQKLLLVAHSQGNFYANSFYDTVAKQEGGVSKESMVVYGVATPASRVAGGGKWLTSDTDKVIAGVVGHVPFKSIMSPNTHIELKSDDDVTGHDFAKVYLKYRGGQIVSDIAASLDALKSNDSIDENTPCIVAPELTRVHKIEGALFAVADPVASKSISAVVAVAKGAHQAGSALAQGIFSVANTLASVFNTSPKEQASAVAETTISNKGKASDGGLAFVDKKISAVVSSESLLALEKKVMLAERETRAFQTAVKIATQKENIDSRETLHQEKLSDSSPITKTEDKSKIVLPPDTSSPSSGFGGGGDSTPQTAQITSSANA